MDTFSEDELDTIIREIIGAERKIFFETGNSTTARNRKIQEIINRRAEGMVKDDSPGD